MSPADQYIAALQSLQFDTREFTNEQGTLHHHYAKDVQEEGPSSPARVGQHSLCACAPGTVALLFIPGRRHSVLLRACDGGACTVRCVLLMVPVHFPSAKTLRIAQELSSLSSSLPLNLSSAVFVRSDEDNVVLMQALITGPEDTPYSGACFLFDICFPPRYPAGEWHPRGVDPCPVFPGGCTHMVRTACFALRRASKGDPDDHRTRNGSLQSKPLRVWQGAHR